MTGRLLVAYSNVSNHVSTTADYLESIHRYSNFDVRYVHVTNGAEVDFDLNEFDAVFQSYCARLPFDGHVSSDFLLALRSFRGVKLIAVQDEYDRTDKVRQAVRQIGYHVFLSVVPPAMLERIYPPEMFPETEFVSVLTGYVPERLERWAPARPLKDRPITIGYRGREIGSRYGDLGFEKVEIGRRIREICAQRGITHDIEWDDAKRIYGDAWYEFIGSCRAILGSESGSNVFDFDGSIEAKYFELAARGGPVPYDEFRPYTERYDREYDMRQISPRVFEAAAMHTPMVLFSGSYSGLLQPDEHFIELKKDFSNVDSILSQLNDLDGLEQMAQRAHRHLVGSGEFSYRRFVELIDGIILRKATAVGTLLRPALEYSSATDFPTDILAEANLRERPTKAPRHPIFFHYKQAAAVYPAEVKRLTAMISQVQTEYAAEAKRLNGIIDKSSGNTPTR